MRNSSSLVDCTKCVECGARDRRFILQCDILQEIRITGHSFCIKLDGIHKPHLPLTEFAFIHRLLRNEYKVLVTCVALDPLKHMQDIGFISLKYFQKLTILIQQQTGDTPFGIIAPGHFQQLN